MPQLKFRPISGNTVVSVKTVRLSTQLPERVKVDTGYGECDFGYFDWFISINRCLPLWHSLNKQGKSFKWATGIGYMLLTTTRQGK